MYLDSVWFPGVGIPLTSPPPYDGVAGMALPPFVTAHVDVAAPAQDYVVGFLFSEDRAHVALVSKRKPKWQVGKLNGIGGKVEPGEPALSAMVREFREETGVTVEAWGDVATLRGPNFIVHFFAAFSDDVWDVQTMEEEEVFVTSVAWALSAPNLMQNLRVFLPLVLDRSGIVKPVSFAAAVKQ